jgi:predicted dehydrogenase
VTVLCDVSAERMAGAAALAPGARCEDEADRVLDASDLDAVAILTTVHGDLLRRALARGLDVFVEKPLCEHPVAAHAVAERARAVGAVVKVGTMREHDRALIRARELLPALGELRFAIVHDVCGRGEAVGVEPMRTLQAAFGEDIQAWRRNALQTALVQMVHDVSIVRALLGPRIAPALGTISPDGWMLCGQLMVDGTLPVQYAVAEFGVARRPGFDQWIQVVGERGTMRVAFDDPAASGSPTALEVTGQAPEVHVTDTYAEEWRDFHDAIHSRRVDLGNVDDAARDIELLWRIACRAGEPAGRYA